MESIVAFILAVLALAFVGLPLFKERKRDGLPEAGPSWDDVDSEADRLLSQKDTALTAIRELEFDHAVGNLSDGDYRELREKYEKRAISLLKTIDDVAAESNGRGRRAERRDVRAGRSRRGERRQEQEQDQALSCLQCAEPYEQGDRFCRVCGAELGDHLEEIPTCPRCGEAFEEGDTFCGGCGLRLNEAASESGPTGRALPDGGSAGGTEQSAPSRQADVYRKRSGRHHRPDRPGGKANR
ncbi:MAG: zinc ribbon domain-containing protein [Chloroflexi bacterium]|nr:zinc ribbon domain-containing protein [Chloroflexota bacterium]